MHPPTSTHRHLRPPLDLQTHPHPTTRYVIDLCMISLTYPDLPTFTHPCPYLSKLAHIHPRPARYVTHPCPISMTYSDLLSLPNISHYIPKLDHTHPYPPLDLQAHHHTPARYATNTCLVSLTYPDQPNFACTRSYLPNSPTPTPRPTGKPTTNR